MENLRCMDSYERKRSSSVALMLYLYGGCFQRCRPPGKMLIHLIEEDRIIYFVHLIVFYEAKSGN